MYGCTIKKAKKKLEAFLYWYLNQEFQLFQYFRSSSWITIKICNSIAAGGAAFERHVFEFLRNTASKKICMHDCKKWLVIQNWAAVLMKWLLWKDCQLQNLVNHPSLTSRLLRKNSRCSINSHVIDNQNSASSWNLYVRNASSKDARLYQQHQDLMAVTDNSQVLTILNSCALSDICPFPLQQICKIDPFFNREYAKLLMKPQMSN